MAGSRKIRFGVALSFPDNIHQWRDMARKVEDLGYDVLLVADHLNRQWAPLYALLAAAEATTRLRVGTQVLANDFRRPIVLAKEVATLDLMTEGRFELGIGVGHPPSSPTGRSDYAQLGIDMGTAGERVTRLEESLAIIKSFLGKGEPFEYEGSFYSTREVQAFPRPVQQPWPPIMIAGAGPRMLRLAAREADIINIAPRPPIKGVTSRGSTGFGLDINGELSIIREAAGDRYDNLELCVFADRLTITDDAAGETQKLADEMGITSEQVLDMPHTLIGRPESFSERILEYRDKYDVSYRIIPGQFLDVMAPVVKEVSGK